METITAALVGFVAAVSCFWGAWIGIYLLCVGSPRFTGSVFARIAVSLAIGVTPFLFWWIVGTYNPASVELRKAAGLGGFIAIFPSTLSGPWMLRQLGLAADEDSDSPG